METSGWRRVGVMALYVALCMFFLMLQVLPESFGPEAVPGPDLVLAVTLCWVIRRPDLLPSILIGAMLLFADMILNRPPGLFALITLCAAVYLQTRSHDLRQAFFLTEFLYSTLMIVAVALVYLVMRQVLLLPGQSVLTTFAQTAFTILIYPIVGFVSAQLFGITRQIVVSG